jgi:5-methylcytosine-specific restriction protein A
VTKRPMIDPGHGGRAVEEWVGKTPDAKAPPRVLLRIFKRANGVCHITGRKIGPGDKWEAEHIIPLHAGGKNVESNLAPALAAAHKEKSAEELAAKAKNDRVAKKHCGIRAAPTKPIHSAGFPQPKPKQRSDRIGKIDKSALGILPKRICGRLLEEFEQ